MEPIENIQPNSKDVSEILKQVDDFLDFYIPDLKDYWSNRLNLDYPFNIPAYDYFNFLKQIEQVIGYYLSFNIDPHHDIIEVTDDPLQAVLTTHSLIDGDKVMAEFNEIEDKLTLNIGIHKLSILIL